MRLTTKFSAFVTLLTGLTIFVTLLGCSLSFYNAIQYKFSHRVQAVATAIDTHLVSNDFSALRPQITELMMSADIVRVVINRYIPWPEMVVIVRLAPAICFAN